jgi:peptidyl-prolyl cis-trans isomerase C
MHIPSKPPITSRRRVNSVRSAAACVVALGLAGPFLIGSAHADDKSAATAPVTPKGPWPQSSAPPTQAALMATIVDLLDKNASHVAIKVGDMPITQGDAAEYIRTMPVGMAGLGYDGVFKYAMEALMREKMMVIEAKKEGLDQDPAVARQAVVLHDKALVDMWLNRKAEAAVTDKALHERYDQTMAGKPGPEEVRVRAILVPTDAEARALIAQLQQGADFAELAKQHSKDPSAARGGDIGYVTLDSVAPDIGSVMFALNVGQVTAFPVRTSPGYFILRVEGRRQKAPLTFDEARPELERALRVDAVRAAVQTASDDLRTILKSQPVAAAAPPK